MDKLGLLIERLNLDVNVFQTGELCGTSRYEQTKGIAHLHVIQQGKVRIDAVGHKSYSIEQPSVLFYLTPKTHTLIPDSAVGAKTVCSLVVLDDSLDSGFLKLLPEFMCAPLQELVGLEPLLQLMFQEASRNESAKQVALNKYSELIIIYLFRFLIKTKHHDAGILAGLSDTKLSKAMCAIHDSPSAAWTLTSLAEKAGMSRAVFAKHFLHTVGITPGSYLTNWRISLAKKWLTQGKSMAVVADLCGYSSNTSFHRAFGRVCGKTPVQWLKAHEVNGNR